MRVDWVPYSAASLVAGAVALALGLVLVPSGDTALPPYETAADSRWLVVACLVLLASVLLLGGLPVTLTLVPRRRPRRLAFAAIGMLTLGCLALAGYAMALVVARAFVVQGGIGVVPYDAATGSDAIAFFTTAGGTAFLAGLLLLALALLRAGTVPRWTVALLAAPVVLLPVGVQSAVPLAVAGTLALTVALAGLGIHANQRVAVPVRA
jgi:hypothetical protein